MTIRGVAWVACVARVARRGALLAAHALAVICQSKTAAAVWDGQAAGWAAWLVALALGAAVSAGRLLVLLCAWRRDRPWPAGLLPLRLLVYALLAGALVHLIWWQPFTRSGFDRVLAASLGAFSLLEAGRARLWRFVPPRLLRGVDLVCANLAAVWILAEFGLRTAAWWWPSPLFAQPHASHLAWMECYRAAPGEVRFGFPCDQHGYYDEAPSAAGTRSRKLVVTIGDSFSTSIVPHVFHYTTVAERQIPWCEIYNVGISAVGPAAYLEMLRRDALPLRPEAVVIAVFVGNDLGGTTRKDPDQGLCLWFDRDDVLTWLVPKRLAAMAAEHRVLGRVAAVQGMDTDLETFLSSRGSWYFDPTQEKPTFSRDAFLSVERARARDACGPQTAAYDALFSDLASMRDACGATPMHVMLIPDEFQVEDDLWREVASPQFDRDQPQRLLRAWLQQANIPCLDLLPELRAVPPMADRDGPGRRHLYHLQDTHLNVRGNRVVGLALAAHLASVRGELTLQGWQVDAGAVRMERPGTPQALPVRARTTDGALRALAWTLPDARLTSSDPSVVAVYGDGQLVATRRGRATITVSFGEQRCAVDVEAQWPSVVDLGSGNAGAADGVPHLALDREVVRSGETAEFRVRGVPAGCEGHVAIEARPLLGGFFPYDLSPYQPQDASLLPFVVRTQPDGSSEARVAVPVPGGDHLVDQAMFCTVIVKDASARSRLRRSNTLAVTVQR